ncbi:MAG: TIGR01777 family oxidoreductase [Balneolaceae bacterium]|jgi:uncharacterized protein (TIGR01777 family)
MDIFITGGTGFIGSYLRTMLLREGHLLSILTRKPAKYAGEEAKNQRFVSWDEDLVAEMDRADAVINLAGSSIFGRWTDAMKKKIYSSRIDTTIKIVEAIEQASNRPSVMVSASAANYYRDGGDRVLDESAEAGNNFLAKVCIEWEKAARPVTGLGVRLAIPRIGVVLERDGGALQQMLLPFKFFMGGSVGSGDQYFPWIHMLDLCRGLTYPLEKEAFEGAYNLNAPNPVKMDEFARILGEQLQRPAFFRMPEFVVEAVLGEAALPILASLRMQPKKLQQHGYEFRFEYLEEALGEIV